MNGEVKNYSECELLVKGDYIEQVMAYGPGGEKLSAYPMSETEYLNNKIKEKEEHNHTGSLRLAKYGENGGGITDSWKARTDLWTYIVDVDYIVNIKGCNRTTIDGNPLPYKVGATRTFVYDDCNDPTNLTTIRHWKP